MSTNLLPIGTTVWTNLYHLTQLWGNVKRSTKLTRSQILTSSIDNSSIELNGKAIKRAPIFGNLQQISPMPSTKLLTFTRSTLPLQRSLLLLPLTAFSLSFALLLIILGVKLDQNSTILHN
jgi:hypothetical protein